MNTAVWVAQTLLASIFLVMGAAKTFPPVEDITRAMPLLADFPPSMIRFIGISELLGAAGIVLPALTGILPALTVWAALGLGTVMALAAGAHLMEGDVFGALFPLLLLAVAAFVVYGRLRLSSRTTMG